jgi:hypothetical protein
MGFEKILDLKNKNRRNEDESGQVEMDFEMEFLRDSSQGNVQPGRPHLGSGFRANFLRKISQEGIWLPPDRRPPRHQTLVIFDWDDTLLCTSFLNSKSRTVSPQNLETIAQSAENLLNIALTLGETYIITNAMHGWVEYSCKKFIPSLMETLQKVKIVSARTRWEEEFPDDYFAWKIQAFSKIQEDMNHHIITNLISVGDGVFEMDAVQVMGSKFPRALVKTVKFRDSPTPEELIKELDLVARKFEKIILNGKNLKIGLERKIVEAPDKETVR